MIAKNVMMVVSSGLADAASLKANPIRDRAVMQHAQVASFGEEVHRGGWRGVQIRLAGKRLLVHSQMCNVQVPDSSQRGSACACLCLRCLMVATAL